MTKNALVYTSMYSFLGRSSQLSYKFSPGIDYKQEGLVSRLIISLREISDYNGKILIFYYGGMRSEKFNKIIEKYDVQVVPIFSELTRSTSVVPNLSISIEVINRKYIDIINFLSEDIDYVINVDTDCWFNEPLDDLLEKIKDIDGVALSKIRVKDGFIIDEADHLFPERIQNYKNKHKELMKIHPTEVEGTITASFMAGNKDAFFKKCSLYKEQVESFYLPWVFGTDQFFVTESFDLKSDIVYANHSTIYNEYKEFMDRFKVIGNKIFFNNIEVKIIHKGYEMFEKIYPQLVEKF